jgi:hypothetical protein
MGLGTLFGGAFGMGGVALGGIGQFGSLTMGAAAISRAAGSRSPKWLQKISGTGGSTTTT